MKAGLIFCALAGVALGVCLVVYFGLDQVGGALVAAGWKGLAAVCAAHLVAQVLCGLAWRVLIVEPPRHVLLTCLWARWVRDSVGNILAVVPAAGEVISAREVTFHGVSLGVAGASVIVDLTTEIVSQLVFTLLGLGLLITQRPHESVAWWAGGGLAVATLAVGAFLVAQRNGLLRILETLPARLGLGRPFESLTEAERISTAVRRIYDRPGRVAASIALHFAGWLAGAAEAWLGLWFMGHPLSVADVLAIESLVFAVRSAAFFVPWAAGVQEGGYLMLGTLFGLPPDIALALALLKRARAIATSVPCLLIWQGLETRRLWRRSSHPQPARSSEAREPSP